MYNTGKQEVYIHALLCKLFTASLVVTDFIKTMYQIKTTCKEVYKSQGHDGTFNFIV